MKNRFGAWIERLANAGVLPSDSEQERRHKAVLTLLVAMSAVACPFWVAMYWALGRPVAAAIPAGYDVATALSLLYFVRTKRYGFFRTSQLCFITALPFLLQASLGGFVPASAAMMWSILAPFGALLFLSARQAIPWFVAYALLTVAFGLLDGWFGSLATPLPAAVVTTLFVMNIVALSGIVFALLLYFARRVEEEHARAEGLLLNILPAPIAERLKRDRHAIADGFAEVTVLFADIVDFTTRSSQMDAAAVVGLLNEVFSEFDELTDRYGLEKIKTIGDAYMVVGGLPEPRPDHAAAVAELALAIQAALAARAARTGDLVRVRIGINTGPVVAGVIGTKKFIYDLWGDAVNIASRMESHGVPEAIQVTEATYERLRDAYELVERGSIEVKGKGAMRTYFLTGRRSEAAPAAASVELPAARRAIETRPALT